MVNDAEQQRLEEDRNRVALWRRWGPYVAARQWGTVREDYSEGGNAWDFFPHEHARSRAYRWGEDGLAGISDHWQHLCFALALWNTQRPDPEGAPLRPDERRGQPRRGRQGVLVGARLDAHPLVHAVALQVPAARVPVRRAGRRQPRPQPRARRARARRHGGVRGVALLRRRDHLREGARRTTSAS